MKLRILVVPIGALAISCFSTLPSASAQTLEDDSAKLLIQQQRLESAIEFLGMQIAAVKAREVFFQTLRTCLYEKKNENALSRNVVRLELEYMHSTKDSWTTGGQIANEALPDADRDLRSAQGKVLALQERAQQLCLKADAAFLAAARQESSLTKNP